MDYSLVRINVRNLVNQIGVLILVVMDYSLVLEVSRTFHAKGTQVLILVVMDYSLVHENGNEDKANQHVLILVVMDYSLVQEKKSAKQNNITS